VSCREKAGPTNMPFGTKTRVDQGERVLGGGPDPLKGRRNLGGEVVPTIENAL